MTVVTYNTGTSLNLQKKPAILNPQLPALDILLRVKVDSLSDHILHNNIIKIEQIV